MKIVQTSVGRQLVISKSEWQKLGQDNGWFPSNAPESGLNNQWFHHGIENPLDLEYQDVADDLAEFAQNETEEGTPVYMVAARGGWVVTIQKPDPFVPQAVNHLHVIGDYALPEVYYETAKALIDEAYEEYQNAGE